MDDGSDRERMIVIRWRKRHQAEALAPTLDKAFPTVEAHGFDEALKAIDEAHKQVWSDCDPPGETSN